MDTSNANHQVDITKRGLMRRGGTKLSYSYVVHCKTCGQRTTIPVGEFHPELLARGQQLAYKWARQHRAGEI